MGFAVEERSLTGCVSSCNKGRILNSRTKRAVIPVCYNLVLHVFGFDNDMIVISVFLLLQSLFDFSNMYEKMKLLVTCDSAVSCYVSKKRCEGLSFFKNIAMCR